jgi:acyl carrier protein
MACTLSALAMDNLEKIKQMVVKQRWEYDFPLTRETTLRKDLKLWGDDAFEFIEAYGREFSVDLSEFDIKKYFPPEGDSILPAIIRVFCLKKEPKYFPLTLGDLDEGIKKGKLV